MPARAARGSAAPLLGRQPADSATRELAHEINNLLQLITLMTEKALCSESGRTEWRRSLAGIQDATERGSRLLRKMMADGKEEASLEEVNLNDIVGGVVGFFSRAYGETHPVEMRLDGRLSAAQLDVDALEQVLVNLLLNARDALPEGGGLVVETWNSRGGRMPQGAQGLIAGKRFVGISVHDKGVGMAPEVLTRVFEPYFSTKGPKKGSGIGMTTVQALVKKQKGLVHVESQPGVGTSVHLLFPLSGKAG